MEQRKNEIPQPWIETFKTMARDLGWDELAIAKQISLVQRGVRDVRLHDLTCCCLILGEGR
jgi:hypothetical protein